MEKPRVNSTRSHTNSPMLHMPTVQTQAEEYTSYHNKKAGIVALFRPHERASDHATKSSEVCIVDSMDKTFLYGPSIVRRSCLSTLGNTAKRFGGHIMVTWFPVRKKTEPHGRNSSKQEQATALVNKSYPLLRNATTKTLNKNFVVFLLIFPRLYVTPRPERKRLVFPQN